MFGFLNLYKKILLNIFIFSILAIFYWKLEPRKYKYINQIEIENFKPYVMNEQVKMKYIYTANIFSFFYSVLFPYIEKINFISVLLIFSEMNAILYSVTNILKYFTSKQRPDFADRMKIGNKKIIVEGLRSFPSGHSATITLCVFFIVFITLLYSNRLIKYFIIIITPLIPYVMISRVVDNRHSTSDVFFGFLIGLIVPVFVIFSRKKYLI